MSYFSLSVTFGVCLTSRFLVIRSRASFADPANSIPPTVTGFPPAAADGDTTVGETLTDDAVDDVELLNDGGDGVLWAADGTAWSLCV
jgi:hypothetical protein